MQNNRTGEEKDKNCLSCVQLIKLVNLLYRNLSDCFEEGLYYPAGKNTQSHSVNSTVTL